MEFRLRDLLAMDLRGKIVVLSHWLLIGCGQYFFVQIHVPENMIKKKKKKLFHVANIMR